MFMYCSVIRGVIILNSMLLGIKPKALWLLSTHSTTDCCMCVYACMSLCISHTCMCLCKSHMYVVSSVCPLSIIFEVII